VKRLHATLERIRDNITPLMRGYDLNIVYKAIMYSIVYAALARNPKYHDYSSLRPIEDKLPKPLIARAKGKLYYSFLDLLELLDRLLDSRSAAIVEGEGNLQVIINWLKREVGKIDYVLIYDCMSLVEFLVVAAYLQSKKIKSVFLSRVFLNPPGLTRFLTQQLRTVHRYEALREVAGLIAETLKGVGYAKDSYLDKKVHEYGGLGIDEFLEIVDINRVADEILKQAVKGRILVGTDHGYDVVKAVEEDYIYVTHGFKPRETYNVIPLLLLSRFALFMEACRRW